MLAALLDPSAPAPGLASVSAQDRTLVGLHMAYAAARSGAVGDARVQAEAAASALPGRPGAALVAAELCRAAGDLTASRSWLDKAEAGLPADAPERPALGWVRSRALLDAGDREGAKAAMSDAARSLPDSVALWGALLSLEEGATIPELGAPRLTGAPGSTR